VVELDEAAANLVGVFRPDEDIERGRGAGWRPPSPPPTRTLNPRASSPSTSFVAGSNPISLIESCAQPTVQPDALMLNFRGMFASASSVRSSSSKRSSRGPASTNSSAFPWSGQPEMLRIVSPPADRE